MTPPPERKSCEGCIHYMVRHFRSTSSHGCTERYHFSVEDHMAYPNYKDCHAPAAKPKPSQCTAMTLPLGIYQPSHRCTNTARYDIEEGVGATKCKLHSAEATALRRRMIDHTPPAHRREGEGGEA